MTLPASTSNMHPAATEPLRNLRPALFRLCFAAVVGAAVAHGMVALWPQPVYDSHAIGFAVWAHEPPGLQTVFYLAFLAGAWAAFAAAPQLLRWVSGSTANPAAADSAAAMPVDGAGMSPWAWWTGWLWVAAAGLLPWQSAQAIRFIVLIGFVAGLERALRFIAADPARWRRLRLGLGVATLGYGAGLFVLDLCPAPTRGMLNWYNPVVAVTTLVAVCGLWWGVGRYFVRRDAQRDGALRAAWVLLPLGALPLWSFSLQTLQSSWGRSGAEMSQFAVLTLCLATVATVALGIAGLRCQQIVGRGMDAPGATADAWLQKIAWIVWPLIFFAMAHERNLRMIGFSQYGLAFDFMHWGEWWDPWWRLQGGGTLWVDVFPIHGVGYDIGPCALADWFGDATLSGRIQVAALLHGLSFVLFYCCLLSISRRRSVALLALAVLLWDQPSWYKVWISDARFLPLFVWALALIGLGRSLAGSSATAVEMPVTPSAERRRSFTVWLGAALVGVLPLANFLTSVDVGYVVFCATVLIAAALCIGGARFGGRGHQARLAGAAMATVLLMSVAGFFFWLGDRHASFLEYHWLVFTDKGWFDSLPLTFAEHFTPSKAVYVLAPPAAVVLGALMWWRTGRRDGSGSGSGFSIALLGLIAATALYYKKGLDRSDTAHFEQAAVLTPVLIAALVGWAAARAERNARPGWPLVLFSGVLCWLGLQQTVETFASHPSRLDIWGLQDRSQPSNVPGMVRAGALHCPPEQVTPLFETLAYIQAHSAAHEPIYDFTNSGLWPFLANRPNPARYSQAFHALNDAMQKQVIADLEKHPPALVLFPDKPAAVDFVDLTLRQHRISAWLLKHYRPVAHVGYYLVLEPQDSPIQPDRLVLDATRFIAEQHHGFVPRAFADSAAAGSTASETFVLECTPASRTLQPEPDTGVRRLEPTDAAPWRFETLTPDGRIAFDLPTALQPAGADWLEIEMAVSGGTHGGLAFFGERLPILQEASQPWWRRIRFRIEPVKQAAQARKYRFHLAAIPNWMFLNGAIARIELQPTDTAGIVVDIRGVRFYKESDR